MTPVLAQSQTAPVEQPIDGPLQLETGVVLESLTNGNSGWQEYYLRGKKTFAPRNTIYWGYRHTERFDLQDEEGTLGGYFPLSEELTGNLELSLCPSHQVLPRYSALGSLNYQLGDGWGLEGALNNRRYTFDNVFIERFTLEKYFDSNRMAYSLWLSQSDTGGSGTSHSLQFTHYYGDDEQNSLNISGSFGNQVETVAPGVQRPSNSTGVALWGVQEVSPGWAITYGYGYNDQDPFYTRQGFNFGLRADF
ncbi:MAG: hypothetical protein AMXMBFR33_12020 [Candidatus Xenobia bacterium]